MESGTVSIREHGKGDKGSMKIDEFVAYFKSLL
jgi:threonyl-tRNA synthetase